MGPGPRTAPAPYAARRDSTQGVLRRSDAVGPSGSGVRTSFRRIAPGRAGSGASNPVAWEIRPEEVRKLPAGFSSSPPANVAELRRAVSERQQDVGQLLSVAFLLHVHDLALAAVGGARFRNLVAIGVGEPICKITYQN